MEDIGYGYILFYINKKINLDNNHSPEPKR